MQEEAEQQQSTTQLEQTLEEQTPSAAQQVTEAEQQSVKLQSLLDRKSQSQKRTCELTMQTRTRPTATSNSN